MVEAIAYALLLLAAVIGFVHIFGVIERKLIFRKGKPSIISVIPLKGHIEEIEAMIRDTLSYRRVRGTNMDAIVLVDTGLDAETRDICEKISKDYSGVVLCDDCQLKNLLQRSIGCKQRTEAE